MISVRERQGRWQRRAHGLGKEKMVSLNDDCLQVSSDCR